MKRPNEAEPDIFPHLLARTIHNLETRAGLRMRIDAGSKTAVIWDAFSQCRADQGTVLEQNYRSSHPYSGLVVNTR